MAQSLSSKSPLCLRTVFREARPQTHFRRSFVTIHRGERPEFLKLPADLPSQYWSQLPERLRPKEKRIITVHLAPQSAADACRDPVSAVDEAQYALLDPTGGRRRLFDRKNPDGAKAGDILHVTFKTGEPFSGLILSVKSRGPQTTVLMRNHLTRVGVEMDIKVFSPLVQSMEVAQKALKRPRRARLYYMRKPKHDRGSVSKIVDQYLRQRAALTGGRKTGTGGQRIQTARTKRS